MCAAVEERHARLCTEDTGLDDGLTAPGKVIPSHKNTLPTSDRGSHGDVSSGSQTVSGRMIETRACEEPDEPPFDVLSGSRANSASC